MPSGPGSIEGLGESFEPQLNSGTATYQVPIAVPPGRGGFAPALTLSYNSGIGNTVFGLGWSISLPCILRQTDKGQPFYADWPNGDNIDNDKDGEIDEFDEFDTYVFSNGEELVPVENTWRCENEAEFIKFERESEGWIATRRDGGRIKMGSTSESRIQDAIGHVFAWLVDEMIDTNGNRIVFTYIKKDNGTMLYCRSIAYNIVEDRNMAVTFSYEKRPDVIVDYRPGFELKTAYRCIGIHIKASGEYIKTYQLEYFETDNQQPLSLLSAVTFIGRDGASKLPPATFTYTGFSGENAKVSVIASPPWADLNNPNIEFIDLNTDGLPDILDTNQIPHSYFLNLGPDRDGTLRWSGRIVMNASPPLYLSTKDVRLADMDGDGKTELQHLQGWDVPYYGLGQNLQWEYEGTIQNVGFLFSDPSIRMLDANGDKRIDVMQTTSLNYFVWLNLPTGQWSGRYTTDSVNPLMQFDRQTTKLADMNGDRIPDLVHLGDEVCFYYPGKGYGEYAGQIRMQNPPAHVIDDTRLFLTDVNGDGLSDVVYMGNSVRIWINLGIDPDDHSKGKFASPFSVSTPLLNAFSTFRQADMNGNGAPDVVWSTSNGKMAYIDFTGPEKPYQLKAITNGIGKITTITYCSSVHEMIRDREAGVPWDHTLPFSVPVVKEVTACDGSNTYTTRYEYNNGYYDGLEKEFRGFARTEKIQLGDVSAPDLITAYVFDLGKETEAFKGKPLMLETKDRQAKVFYRENYTWSTRVLHTGTADESCQVTFVFRQLKTQDVLERGISTPVQLKWEYQYDDYGNLIKTIEHGSMDGTWDDERIIRNIYSAAYPSGQSNWILNSVIETTIEDEHGVIAAKKRHYYDKSNVLGEIEKGNLTKTEEWVSKDRYVTTVCNDYDQYGNIIAGYDGLYGSAPGHFREFVYDTIYHAFPIEEKIHTGDLNLNVKTTYDYGFGTITSSTDFNGHTTSYGYDPFGRLIWVIKPPDTEHTVEYDYVLAYKNPAGSMINWVETRERDGSPDGFLKSRTYYDGLGRKIMTRSEGEESGQIVVTGTVQFNARKVAWKKHLPYFETGTLDFTHPTFNTGFTEHFYDALGREVKSIQPDGSFATISYAPLSETIRDEEQTHASSKHFGCGMRHIKDGLGRLREVHEIVKSDDSGNPLTEPIEIKTSYSYNLLDKVTRHTDPHGNQRIMKFDGLGRNVFSNDPDRGKIENEYDDAGNLIRSKNAEDQVIAYTYDGANRITGEYFGGDISKEPDVSYHYDIPFGAIDRGYLWSTSVTSSEIANALLAEATRPEHDLNQDGFVDVADVVMAVRGEQSHSIIAENTLGSLSWVKDHSGEEHISYDERGRLLWVVKRIIDDTFQSTKLRNFYSGFAYDSMDRITELTYPDNTSIGYNYNSRGLLDSVPGVIECYNYNPTGQNLFLTLTCGAQTAYNYDSRLRLDRLQTTRMSDNRVLQDLEYGYDMVSNILSITDNRDVFALSNIGSELGLDNTAALRLKSNQTFEYDSFYRLTQAANTATYGTINYRYDHIGNMISKHSALIEPDPFMDLGTMITGGMAGTFNRIGRELGDSPGPHALTNVEKGPDGPINYFYDQKGNVTSTISSNQSKTFVWDYLDRLIQFSNGSLQARYVYDYSGIRKKKEVINVSEGNQADVFYINKYSELRDGVLIKYVYAGMNRIALFKGSETTLSAFFLHDHLGSNSMTLNPEGKVAEYMAYYPYGHRRLIHSSHQEKVHASYQFIGKEHEEEIGLYYFEARWQDPVTGRFFSTDPVEQGFNVYAYANNNPISYVDTDGEFAWFIPVMGFALGYTSNALATNDWSFKNNFVPGLIGAATSSVGYLAGGSHLSAEIGFFENLGYGMTSGAASMATSNLLTYSFYTNNWNLHDFMGAGISGATQGAFLGAASAGITYGVTKGIDFFSDVLNSPSLLDKEATFENTFGKVSVYKGSDYTLNDLTRVPTKSYDVIKDWKLTSITYKTDTFLNRCMRWPIKSVIKPAMEWSLGLPDTYRGILEKWGYHALTQIATNRNIHEVINNKNLLEQVNLKFNAHYKVRF